MDILRCIDMFLITKILDLAYVQNYMRCLSQNKSDTKLTGSCFARSHRSLNHEVSDKYTLTITCIMLHITVLLLNRAVSNNHLGFKWKLQDCRPFTALPNNYLTILVQINLFHF